jgi:poly-gamma-glutamate synthesis protein (capsule biosynthesis protein)
MVDIFLSGDVMTGRGIDQILPHPSEAIIYESYVKSAQEYVRLAEEVNGSISSPVGFDYVWGDALDEFQDRSPDVRLINLETAVTTSDEPVLKGINYRMHPANAPCLSAGGIDCCVLANNHVMDWGTEGLLQTIDVLYKAGIAVAGVGSTLAQAAQPAELETAANDNVIVFGLGSLTSGIPANWSATDARPGVWFLPDYGKDTANQVVATIRRFKRDNSVSIASIHWGANWGYEIPSRQRQFAHRLIDSGTVDLVHGHSSHHRKGIEVYKRHLILYGCGDCINDYEGIPGYEQFRPQFVLAYFARLDNYGCLLQLEMVPFRLRRFRLERAGTEDAEWLGKLLNQQGRALNTAVESTPDSTLLLRW